MSRRRVAIIGLGMALEPHARSLVELGDRVEVAAAVGTNRKHRDACAERFGFPPRDSLDDVVRDPSITAALILTPPHTHLEVARRLADAGKHILCEKPVEGTTEKAEALVELCRRRDVTLAINFQHRFRPVAQAMAQRLREGALGEIAAASVAVRWWRPQNYYDQPGRGTLERDGGGVLMTQAIHILDLFLSFVGPLAEVAAFAGTTRLHRMECEDICGAAIRLANGGLGTLDCTTASYPGFPERIEIVGTKATALLCQGLEIRYQDGRVEEVPESAGTGGGADPMAFPNDNHRRLLADFLDAIDQGRDPIVSGESALAVHRLIDALLRSSAERRAVSLG